MSKCRSAGIEVSPQPWLVAQDIGWSCGFVGHEPQQGNEKF
ncbi:MAG: hypothetical protein ABIP35_04880 [Ginsengibacter sp.]